MKSNSYIYNIDFYVTLSKFYDNLNFAMRFNVRVLVHHFRTV